MAIAHESVIERHAEELHSKLSKTKPSYVQPVAFLKKALDEFILYSYRAT